MFSENKGFLGALEASFGVPFECGMVSESVRTHVDYVRSVEQQGNVGCMGHSSHNGLRSLGCHGDAGGNALVQHCLSLHCSGCFQQIYHFFAAAAVVAVDGGVVVSLMTSPAGCRGLRLYPQTLHYLLLQWMWHCGYV